MRMRGFVSRLPLKAKLTLIILATCLMALTLAGTALALRERATLRQGLAQDLSTLGKLIADRSTAAILFEDPQMIRENLAALRGKSSVTGGAIYNGSGQLLATYAASGGDAASGTVALGPLGTRFEGDHVTHTEPILQRGTRIGTLCIRAHLRDLRAQMLRSFLISGAILSLAGLVALGFSARLQRIVLSPLAHLSATARRITLRKDYSLRAVRETEDELGVLVDAFNAMLQQIQERDGHLRDVNERLEQLVAEKTFEWRSASEQLQAIFEAATSGIVLVKDRTIIRCNRRMDDLFGHAPGSMVGQSTRSWYPDEATYEAVGGETADCLRRGVMFTRDQMLVRKDGSTFWGRMTAQAADRSDPSRGMVGLIEDITAEREHAESLRLAKERAEAADQIKSAFLATMSHELRTPLNSIIGFTGILLQGLVGPMNDEQKKQLGMVRDSSRHLLDLINDVLDISKIEAGQLEVTHQPFDLRESLEKAVRGVHPLAERKGIALELALAPDLNQVVSDRRRVEQVVLNLLSNAIKFTERGGVLLSATGREGTIEIRVRDTGIGIRSEDMDTLFKPFRQIDSGLTRKYEGTGLGLSISKRLVELLGGQLRVESQPEAGSTFIVTLPAQGVRS